MLQSLEREVGVLMRRSRRVVAERAAMVAEELTPAAYLMLAHLTHAGPRRASDLVDTFHLDKGAVSRSVHMLVELGLVTKEADPEDGRAVILSVTDLAERRVREVSRARLGVLEDVMDEWSQEDLAGFVKAFSRYNEMLERAVSERHGAPRTQC